MLHPNAANPPAAHRSIFDLEAAINANATGIGRSTMFNPSATAPIVSTATSTSDAVYSRLNEMIQKSINAVNQNSYEEPPPLTGLRDEYVSHIPEVDIDQMVRLHTPAEPSQSFRGTPNNLVINVSNPSYLPVSANIARAKTEPGNWPHTGNYRIPLRPGMMSPTSYLRRNFMIYPLSSISKEDQPLSHVVLPPSPPVTSGVADSARSHHNMPLGLMSELENNDNEMLEGDEESVSSGSSAGNSEEEEGLFAMAATDPASSENIQYSG